ncbi:VWA domain-containing protein [Bacillus paranthracis]|uniref:VWA domain-containing protein n=1 Tax=Bacillus paranthracis TaxID=2026186 RepID=UPI002D772788|nr:VWA domain-containing protein [Bacillus paranthracis]
MSKLIDLTKKAKTVMLEKNIFGEKAQVAVADDISISMDDLYYNGTMQELNDRLLSIGMNLDIDKSIDVFAFGRDSHEIGVVTEGNYQGFVDNVLLKKVSFEGSTNYAGVMDRIVKKYGQPPVQKQGFLSRLMGSKPNVEKPTVPTLVFFITDGNNFDEDEAEAIIRQSSNQAIFWQFVGVGGAEFEFLDKLDKMSGRFIDNANFFQIDDLREISDEEFMNRILNEFPQWIKEARAKGVLA